MLTALELENFKGIAARQRVEFAPLTLLFGANSAGKSTVLQALLYLHELVERGSADVDRTELGGGVIELGGFARIIHRHDIKGAIVLRAEFATPSGLERLGRDLTDFPFPDVDDEIESAWLELTIRFRTTTTFQGPLVERAVIGVGRDLEPLVWLETGATLREGEPLIVRVNLSHPVIAKPASAITEAWAKIAVPEEVFRAMETQREAVEVGLVGGAARRDPRLDDGRSLMVFAVSRSRNSALPPAGEPLRVIASGDRDDLRAEVARLANRVLLEPDPGRREDLEVALRATEENLHEELRGRERSLSEVRTFLEMVVLGTTVQLATSLRDALYIGPLRTIPRRGFLYEGARRNANWADGLAAWDLLLSDRLSLVERTNEWLRRLGAGCQVVVHELVDWSAAEKDGAHVEETVRRLLLDTGGSWVLPSEVGAGISQVIPVVVAALEGRAGLALIEQPELHVHPSVQVGLGDLFIDAVMRDGGRRTMLIETHSEHLILRILRRIRETTDRELGEGAPAFSADKLSVLYVESDPDGVQIRRLQVDESGEFTDRWPKGFFAERMEELL